MDYGNLFSRALDIIWKNKFLILLGVLIALGGAGRGPGGGGQGQYAFSEGDFDWGDLPQLDFSAPLQDLDLPLFAAGGILAVVAILILIGISFWALGTIARGALINGVNEIDQGNPTNFSEAFRAGWNKAWKLMGIGIIPAIPGFVILVIGLFTFFAFGGIDALTHVDMSTVGLSVFLPLIVLGCLLIPISMILSLLSTFAYRACMLEDHDVISAYRRGFEVLGDHLGPAVILFLIQVAIRIGISVMMLIPGILIALCCLLWPLFILIEAAFTTFYSTIWTLAWSEWVGGDGAAPSDQ